MGRHGGQAIVWFTDACHGSRAHPVENPEHAVTFDRFRRREVAKVGVAAEQNPRPGLRERKGKAIREGQGGHLSPVGKGAADAVAIKHMDRQTELSQFLAIPVLQFLPVKQVGDRKLAWQAESGVKKGPTFQFNED